MSARRGEVLGYAQLLRSVQAVGAEELPVVLGRGAPDDANRDGPAPDVCAAPLVEALAAARTGLAARTVGPGGIRRLCLSGPGAAGGDAGPAAVGAGMGTVTARREPGDGTPVHLAWSEPREREVSAFLGAAAPACCPEVRVPLSPLTSALGGGVGPCADAIAVAGAGPADAERIAGILCAATCWTEIVRVRGRCGNEAHTPAAVVAYDSPHGRMIAAPSPAPGGELWVTFGPGDDARLVRGLVALDALAAGIG